MRGEEKRELGFGEGIVYTADLAGLHRWIKSTATIALRVGLWPSARPRPGCYDFLFIFFYFLLLFDITGERFPKWAKRLFKRRLNGKQ